MMSLGRAYYAAAVKRARPRPPGEVKAALTDADRVVCEQAAGFVDALARRRRLYARHGAAYSEKRLVNIFGRQRYMHDPSTREVAALVRDFLTDMADVAPDPRRQGDDAMTTAAERSNLRQADARLITELDSAVTRLDGTLRDLDLTRTRIAATSGGSSAALIAAELSSWEATRAVLRSLIAAASALRVSQLGATNSDD